MNRFKTRRVYFALFCRCAIDEDNGHRSAVKKLINVFVDTQTAVRAHRELRSLTALRHENVSDLQMARYVGVQTFTEDEYKRFTLSADYKEALAYKEGVKL